MTLKIAKRAYLEMLAAARAAAPLEACGMLAGNEQRATLCYTLTNADASAEHYSMLPVEQFAATKDMRAKGVTLLAVWHSHPASPARMSAEDMRLAYTPNILYTILSLEEPENPQTRAFEVRKGVAHEIPVIIGDKE